MRRTIMKLSINFQNQNLELMLTTKDRPGSQNKMADLHQRRRFG